MQPLIRTLDSFSMLPLAMRMAGGGVCVFVCVEPGALWSADRKGGSAG